MAAAFQMRGRWFPMAGAPLTYRRPATRACAHETLSLSLRRFWVGNYPWNYRLSTLIVKQQPCLFHHDRDFATTSLGVKDQPLRDLIQKTKTGGPVPNKFEAEIVYEDGYDSDSDGDSDSDSEDSESEEEDDDELDDFELTYCDVEFVSTQEPKKSVKVTALVDTGATDSELRQKHVEQLNLKPEKEFTYETATGKIKQLSYEVLIRVKGRETITSVTASSEESFISGQNTDNAILGHAALSRMGLLVNPRLRQVQGDAEEHMAMEDFLDELLVKAKEEKGSVESKRT